MSIKILHLADVHYCRETKDLALVSLKCAIEKAREEKIDLWALASDLFDRGIQNSDRDGIGELIQTIRNMLDIAPIACVYGTPSHDVPGCYDVLECLNEQNRFIVLRPGIPHRIFKKDASGLKDSFLVFGIPEPSKAWLVAGTEKLDREAINEQIRVKLREILLGYGAIRKQHPDIPCLFLYHGLINGAEACSGQTLTGDIAISKDDLAMVGADYYALGHIHKAQQIPGLPAYYSGSVFPVNWGELDQKKFNMITIYETEKYPSGSFSRKKGIDFFPFPHPPRKKIVLHCDIPMPIDNPWSGFQTWLVLNGTKEQLSGFNASEWGKRIMSEGALPGSRVTVSEIPTETVRAIEIQGRKPLREKVTIWARQSNETRQFTCAWKSILEKADLLEKEAYSSGIIGQARAWRIQSVKTRGLKGIKRGMGLDEYEINFESFNPGLIALVAEMGTGKTTMLKNCHPYASMLDDTSKLQDAFCLRDSYREIYVIDDLSGEQYRGRMLIDGVNPSGKAEYYLEKRIYKDDPLLEWAPIATGKKAYEEAVTKLFGSEEIFVRSAFIPSKPTKTHPDISMIPQSEKKRIFYELAGIGHYAVYTDRAKEFAKTISELIKLDQAFIDANSGLAERIKNLEASHSALEGSKKIKLVSLSNMELTGKKLKSEFDCFEKMVKKNDELKTQISSIKSDLEKHEKELRKAESVIREANSILMKIPDKSTIEADIKKHADLSQEKLGIEQEKLEHDEKMLSVKKLQAERSNIQDEIATLEGRACDINKSLNSDVHQCPRCGAMINLDEKKLTDRLNVIEENLRKKRILLHEFDENHTIDDLRITEFPHSKTSRIEVIRRELSGIRIDESKKLLSMADEKEREKSIAENTAKRERLAIKEIEDSILEKSNLIDNLADTAFADIKKELEDLRNKYNELKSEISGIDGQIKAIEDEITNSTAKVKEVEEVQARITDNKKECSDWEFIARCCGVDGIPALELDAVAPEIAQAANEQLSEAYDQRFKIEFRTTRITGNGSKTKQIEDFSIWVTDSEKGWTQRFETVSGGEEAFLNRAVADAFGIIKTRNTGIQFKTVAQDELDGKIDPENRRKFFIMLEKSHHDSGRHHTVVVTHSSEIQEMITQKIEMRKAK